MVRSTLDYLSFGSITVEQVIYSKGCTKVCWHLSFGTHFVLTHEWGTSVAQRIDVTLDSASLQGSRQKQGSRSFSLSHASPFTVLPCSHTPIRTAKLDPPSLSLLLNSYLSTVTLSKLLTSLLFIQSPHFPLIFPPYYCFGYIVTIIISILWKSNYKQK